MSAPATIPMVSIILPTYNRQQFIIEAIESVRAQTYSNWELIVVNDQSTDNTCELIKDLGDDRIRLHNTTKRLGITGSRNEGLRLTKGNLIAFIDSDDLWATSKLEKQVNAFAKYPEAGLCMTGGYNFKRPGEPWEFFYKHTEGEKYDDLLVSFFRSEVAATTPSLMFTRKCLDVTGIFDENKSFADVDFILRLSMQSKGIILYEQLFYRRIHDKNVSGIEWEKGCEEGIQLARSYKTKLPAKVGQDALFKAWINFGEKCIANKKFKKAIGKFLHAWRSKPFSIIPLKKIAKAVIYSCKK